MGKASMSWLTALSLSFNNLRTKKGRTILTAFAGSIGIIGIALILSLSNGVNNYIDDLQKSTMTSYPIAIAAQSMDLSSLMAAGQQNAEAAGEIEHERDAVYSNGMGMEMASTMTASITENNLTAFKEYLDDPDSDIHQYIGENGIVYSYDTAFSLFTYDEEGTLVNTDGSTLDSGATTTTGGMMIDMGQMVAGTTNKTEQLMPGADGELVSPVLTENYDLLYGAWPAAYDEIVLVLDRNNEIDAATLYQLGLLPASEYREVMQHIKNGEEITMDTERWSYEEICGQSFYLIPACDFYVQQESGLFADVSDDPTQVEQLLAGAVELRITGIIRPSEEADSVFLTQPLGYTSALTDYLVDYTAASPVVAAQLASPERSVLTGAAFAPADDAARAADTRSYLAALTTAEKAEICRSMLQSAYSGENMAAASETQLAAALDAYVASAEPGDAGLLAIYDSYVSPGTYEDNMSAFGYVNLDTPLRH